ncbi:hypothetical protein D3C86_1632690 [compost metagenome]
MAQRGDILGRHLEQVAAGERSLASQPVVLGIGQRARGQHLAALDAHHRGALRGQRQREIADAAEQVEQPVRGRGVQQAQRTADQHAVDLVIDLREIGRLERHADAELGQRVSQFLVCRIERIDRVRTLRLEPELHAVAVGEGA